MKATTRDHFIKEINSSYGKQDDGITIGAAMLDGEVLSDARVSIPLQTINRHGLIAGATGTGKTKTVQLLAGELSKAGVPVMMMDLKGDLSGIAAAGSPHPKIDERMERIGAEWTPAKHPVELLTISDGPGVSLRATVSEFGPVLFSKVLGLNDTQAGVMAVVFKYCDDHRLPLLNLADVKKTLHYLSGDGKEEVEKTYGRLATSSVGSITRKLLEIEQQGADRFFGEPSFEVSDLCRTTANGEGFISILRLTDIQDKPKLFSTFMLSLLAEVYASFPEVGDLDKPRLVIFLDEAHLIFEQASNVLLSQLEAIVKLIRSKGVGIFFCTQNPADIPADILGQLGLKVQHALRGFTAKDRKAIKLAAENYPISQYYKTDQVLTNLGIGEALVTALDDKGRPTALVVTYLCAPDSRMNILNNEEIQNLVGTSVLSGKYNTSIDRDSAEEMLTRKLEAATSEDESRKRQKERDDYERVRRTPKGKSTLEKILTSTTARQMGRTFVREVTRGLLGVLGLGGKRR